MVYFNGVPDRIEELFVLSILFCKRGSVMESLQEALLKDEAAAASQTVS